MSAPHLAPEALTAWNDLATFWDAAIGKDGNKYWRKLQEPSLTRLLGDKLAQPNCRALELATGNGLVARWLAARGANVVATDGSEAMVKVARARGDEEGIAEGDQGGEIRYRVLDVARGEDYGFGDAKFDIVVCNMAIMDIADIEPLAEALPRILAKDGVFVASVLHPVFFTSNATRKIELGFNPETGDLEVSRSKVITTYLDVPPARGIACPGQPTLQRGEKLYFHRPMGELFTTFFRHGLAMDGMEELAFTEEDHDPKRVESSTNYTQLPALLAWRMRLAA
ncbi:hypothetical protein OQA88_7997 [Cercophora sp. LCS_1]